MSVIFSVTRRYAFEAAHWLPLVADGHKCKRVHGHNYEIEVTVDAYALRPDGFIIDFWDLDKIVDPIVERVDHRTLNEIAGLGNPTAELISKWFFDAIKPHIIGGALRRVRCFETKNCWADYIMEGPML